MSKAYTIVGIDPGTTVGIAVLGFDGRLLGILSSKELSVNSIVEKILEYGIPSIVATDVSTVPQTVEKIAVSLGARIFFPPCPILVKEKNEIAKQYPSVKNAHERDALSAALKAYQHFINKFENIDSRLKELGLEGMSEDVKALVVKEHSVSKAIDLLSIGEQDERPSDSAPKPTREPNTRDVLIGELQSRILNQKMYIDELEKKRDAQGKLLEQLQRRIDLFDHQAQLKAKRTKQIVSKNNIIKNQQVQLLELKKENTELKRMIEELREIRMLDLQDRVLVCKVLDQFNKSSISCLDERFTIRKDDIIYIGDCSGGGASAAQLLCDKRIKAIIHGNDMSHTAIEQLKSCGVALISACDVPIRLQEDYGIIDKDSFEHEYGRWKMKYLEERKKETHDWLDGLIKDYRYERRRKSK